MNEIQHSPLLAMVEQMPPFPKSVHRIVEMANDIQCAPKDLVQVIEHDPVMTMKMLKLVNSAFFGLSRKIASIHHALVYLGLNTVKNLALSIATMETLPRQKTRLFDTEAFLLHSLTTASVAQAIAMEFGNKNTASDAFIGGLLHDFGKVVFAQSSVERFTQAVEAAKVDNQPLSIVERRFFGADHAEVGGMLAERWELPVDLVRCIRQHHQPQDGDIVSDCIFAANQLSKMHEFGFSGNPVVEELPDISVQRLGVNLNQVGEQMGDFSRFMDEALVFIRL